jgi:hypothetical protein
MMRFLMWTSAWVDLVVVIIDILTFGFWYPGWDIDYYTYLTGEDVKCLHCPHCGDESAHLKDFTK